MNCIILTFHSELNYGAAMQAYALQKYLKKSNNVNILNINMKKDKQKFLREILTLNKKKNFNKFIKNNFNLSKKVKSLDDVKNILKQYDYAIVGSDQVWAFDLIKGYEDVFYLNMDIENTKKISYAASFGKDENIINNKQTVCKYLKHFDKISVREESSKELLNNMGIDCIDVADPTLLLNAEEYVQYFNLTKKSKKYILVYMLVIDEEIVNIVNEINKKLDMDIICFNNKNRFGKRCKCVPNASPEEFVELFYNASFVVTNSFHGTCFSIIFKKNFISVSHKSKGIRQINLLKKAGLLDRLYDKNKNIQEYLTNDIFIDKDFENYINTSRDFLDKLK